jgi:hypothetical protein
LEKLSDFQSKNANWHDNYLRKKYSKFNPKEIVKLTKDISIGIAKEVDIACILLLFGNLMNTHFFEQEAHGPMVANNEHRIHQRYQAKDSDIDAWRAFGDEVQSLGDKSNDVQSHEQLVVHFVVLGAWATCLYAKAIAAEVSGRHLEVETTHEEAQVETWAQSGMLQATLQDRLS